MLCGIYQIRNLLDGKVYIGSSKNIKERFKAHKKSLNLGKHYNIHIQRSWNLCGDCNFVFEILEECIQEELIELEIFHIKNKNSFDRNFGYNIGYPDKKIVSEESKRKMSEVAKLKYEKNPELKIKIGSSVKEYYNDKMGPMTGFKHSEETKIKIGNRTRGKTFEDLYGQEQSDIIKEKTASKHKGMKRPEGFGKKIGDILKHHYDEHPEEKEKISQKLKGIPHSQKRIENIRKGMEGKGRPNLRSTHQKKRVCPHCGKEGGNTMVRFHFDKCKDKFYI
jgi:group I intron endonuclease